MTVASGGEEHIFNYSHVVFKEYVRFMSEQTGADHADTMKAWTDDWRKAYERLQDLKAFEAAEADDVAVRPVSGELTHLVDQAWADPVFKRSFSAVPVEIGMVELDRLVVWQTLVSTVHTQRLRDQLGPKPDPEKVFRFCLPFDRPVPEHRWAKTGDESFAFTSASTDLRFLEAVVLRPDQLRDYQPFGPVAGIVGLVVGYGSNYLNVLAAEGRMVLNNGNHRAYALRSLGVTHVPCVVQKVGSRDELNYVASGGVRRHPDFYLTAARPPVMKDFFDPLFTRKVMVGTTAKQVRVSYSAEDTYVP